MISNKFNPNSILHLATLHTVCDVVGESLRSVSRVLANGKFVQHGVSRTFEHGWTDVVRRARLNLIIFHIFDSNNQDKLKTVISNLRSSTCNF